MNLSTSAAPSFTVLVVDDEPMVTLYLTTHLEALGFIVHAANSAEQALQLARRYTPLAAAFVDLALPDRSGLELIAALEALQAGLPVVIASGYGEMALRDVDDQNRAPIVLSKPFNPGMIDRCIRDLGLAVPPSAV